MRLERRLDKLAEEPLQPSGFAETLFQLARRGSHSLHLSPALSVERCVLIETEAPPKVTRGLSDLIVRRVEERDIPAVAALDNRDPELFHRRLQRGDWVYLGQLDGEVVCHTCLHRGPTPFEEERRIFVPWALGDASTYWSYDAWAPIPLRSAGVVAKVFQLTLREIFEVHGGRRVRGFIHDWNTPSMLLHERLGFKTLGTVTTVAGAGMKWVRWQSGGKSQAWLLARKSDFALPPAAG